MIWLGAAGIRAAETDPSTTTPEEGSIPGVPWPGTDALGRSLPLSGEGETVAPRLDRKVGLFYFLWLDQVGKQAGPFDVSRILAADPDAMKKPTSPPWGPLLVAHHWGEPLFGYYLSYDPWVLRKHAQMLTDAGVDFLIFDTSNKVTYPRSYTALMDVFRAMRQEGNRTPQVAFLTPFWDPTTTVRELHEQLYSRRLYEELWFRWDGKPLILADPEKVDPPIRPFFTFRKPQPDYFVGPTGPDQWSWLEVFPQHVFKNSRGEKEQLSVGVAQNAVSRRLGSMSEPESRGRSFHAGSVGTRPTDVALGLNLAEQWSRAIEEDPRVVLVTGWNEWIAGRFDEFNGIKTPPMFVDEFDQEHSRDIEPMRGGHGDSYYYQLIANIRRFKGVPEIPTVTSRPIRIDGRFEDWEHVSPEFRDTIGDTAHRDHPGYGAAGPYVNTTGRNDLLVAKVSRDEDSLYFYVRTRELISPVTDENWMLLFLDTDANPKTGWLGYDFVVNRSGVAAGTTRLERCLGEGYRWGEPIEVPSRVVGDELELAIPRQALRLTGPSSVIDFKWADNILQTGEASDFTLHGDVAPNDRFNFRARFDDSQSPGRTP